MSGVAAIASFFFALLAILNGQSSSGNFGNCRVWGVSWFSAMEFQTGKNFYGRWRSDVFGFHAGHAGPEASSGAHAASNRLDDSDSGSGSPNLRHNLGHRLQIAPRVLPFATPGKDHTAHRLANLPLGQRGAVLVIYGVGMFFGCLAVMLSRTPLQRPLGLGAVLIFSTIAAVVLFEKLPYERQKVS